MKKVLIVSFLIGTSGIYAQNIGINSTGTNPDASAILDVESADKGMLIPRVALLATNNSAPVSTPATSLLVYNTATSGSGVTAVMPGFYYWNGTDWEKMITGNTISTTDDQNLTGATLTGTNLQIDIENGSSTSVDLSALQDHDWYEVGGTTQPNAITDNIYTQGKVGIGTVTPNLFQSMITVESTTPGDGRVSVNETNTGGVNNPGYNIYNEGTFEGGMFYDEAGDRITFWNDTEVITIDNNDNVGIGANSPVSSAKLEVASINKGVLFPRMSEAQKNAIVTPATGLLVYQLNNTNGFYYYDGTQWVFLGGGGSSSSNSLVFTADGF